MLYFLQDCCDECKIYKQITFSNYLAGTNDPKDDRVKFGQGDYVILNIQKNTSTNCSQAESQAHSNLCLAGVLPLSVSLIGLYHILCRYSVVYVNLVFIASVVKLCNVVLFNFAVLAGGSNIEAIQLCITADT